MMSNIHHFRRLVTLLLVMLTMAGSGVTRFVQAQVETDQRMTSVAWSPDGRAIVSATSTGNIQIWDVGTGIMLYEFQGHTGAVYTISWHPDGTRFATTSHADKLVRIWESNTGQMIAELPVNAFYEQSALIAWNPTGTPIMSVAIVTDGGAPLQISQVVDDTFQQQPATINVTAYDLAWSPDGTRFAMAHVIGIYIFDDLSSLEPRAIVPFHSSLAWSPDGTKLVAGEILSGTINVIDVATGRILNSFQWTPRDNEDGIASVAWSPDGLVLLADNRNGTIQSWDALTGELLQTWSLSRRGGKSMMSLSRYGGRLAVGNSTPLSEITEQAQVESGVIQSLADGAIQILVPAPSLDRLNAIAALCVRDGDTGIDGVSAVAQTPTTFADLPAFVARVEALPADAIPPACAADLLAVAEALLVEDE
jgi:WD40 repeat protein